MPRAEAGDISSNVAAGRIGMDGILVLTGIVSLLALLMASVFCLWGMMLLVLANAALTLLPAGAFHGLPGLGVALAITAGSLALAWLCGGIAAAACWFARTVLTRSASRPSIDAAGPGDDQGY